MDVHGVRHRPRHARRRRLHLGGPPTTRACRSSTRTATWSPTCWLKVLARCAPNPRRAGCARSPTCTPTHSLALPQALMYKAVSPWFVPRDPDPRPHGRAQPSHLDPRASGRHLRQVAEGAATGRSRVTTLGCADPRVGVGRSGLSAHRTSTAPSRSLRPTSA